MEVRSAWRAQQQWPSVLSRRACLSVFRQPYPPSYYAELLVCTISLFWNLARSIFAAKAINKAKKWNWSHSGTPSPSNLAPLYSAAETLIPCPWLSGYLPESGSGASQHVLRRLEAIPSAAVAPVPLPHSTERAPAPHPADALRTA